MDGLVSVPSLHAAVGAMGIWTARRHRWLFGISCLLNTGLIVATFVSGSHYVIDTVAGVAMVGAVVIFWQAGLERLSLPSSVRTPSGQNETFA